MKKILLIGQLTDISGYGHAARSYLTTLSKIEDISLKCLNFSFEKKEIYNNLVNKFSITNSLSVKQGRYSKSDVDKIFDFIDDKTEIIFFLTNDWLAFGSNVDEKLIHERINLNLLCKQSNNVFPCVVWETDSIPDIWMRGYKSISNIKKMICACKWNAEVFQHKTDKECIVLPYVLQKDDEYDHEYYLKLLDLKKDNFIFCNVSQWSNRKGMEELLRSFYLEFQNDEAVLILKTYTNEALTGQKSTTFLSNKILEIKNSISHYSRKIKFKCKVILIDEILTKEQINSIYKVSDAYATCTKGEGFGLPIAEFLINAGKPVVTPNKGGHLDFINDNNFFIESSYEPALIPNNHHYSELEMNYVQVSITSAKKALRKAFENNENKDFSNLCNDYLSLENNIRIMKQILELE
jgi:glycosyltransferase involved in cell wall biosynthesis